MSSDHHQRSLAGVGEMVTGLMSLGMVSGLISLGMVPGLMSLGMVPGLMSGREVRSQVRCPGGGVPCHVTYPMIHLILPPPTPCGQSGTRENITFPQRRLRPVIINM